MNTTYIKDELQRLKKLGNAFSEIMKRFLSVHENSLPNLIANINEAIESDDAGFVQEINGDIELLVSCFTMLREEEPDGFRFLIENLENIKMELLEKQLTLQEQEW